MKRPPRRGESLAYLICLVLYLLPEACRAHSFGTPYVPPVPFWMYAYGCAATLLVTFILLGFLAGTPTHFNQTPTRAIGTGPIARPLGRWIVWILRAGAVGSLLLTILAGFIGIQDAADNIGMTLFWVVFLLGFAYLTLLAGDLYALINPWRLAVAGLERLGFDLSRARLKFPAWLGCWPAFLFYVVLIWLELLGSPQPATLSIVLLVYTAITLVGVAAFGKAAWFSNAEAFSVFFRLIGKLAPVDYRQEAGATWQVRLRPPLMGVLDERPWHMGLVLFVLFMLSSTTYDSIHDTALWIGLFWKNALWLLQPLWGTDLGKAQSLLMDWYLIYRQAGLVLFPFLYLVFYLFVLLCAKLLTRTTLSLRNLALEFCYSLLPIAVAYHFAHYCAFLAVQGDELPRLISDPFGFGWNLLGLEPSSESAPLKMGVIWHTQVAVVLLGHVASTYLSHVMAMRVFPTRRQAVISQLPLLLLMVVYTLVGLWVLSLPLGSDGG